MQINSLRGLLTEYGEVMGKSRVALGKAIPHVLARLAAQARRDISNENRMRFS